MTDDCSESGLGLEDVLREAVAWRRGEVAPEVHNVEPMPAERIHAIRREVARSAAAFERRFSIPAATPQNWEQGRRRPDPAAGTVANPVTGYFGRRRPPSARVTRPLCPSVG